MESPTRSTRMEECFQSTCTTVFIKCKIHHAIDQVTPTVIERAHLINMQHESLEVAVPSPSFVAVGPRSTMVQCPSCHASIYTRVEHNPTTKTHIIAVLLCVFSMIPCVILPYVIDSCKNADHYCPSCNAYIGTYPN